MSGGTSGHNYDSAPNGTIKKVSSYDVLYCIVYQHTSMQTVSLGKSVQTVSLLASINTVEYQVLMFKLLSLDIF